MKIKEISELLDAIILYNPLDDETDFECACGADLMSDVLAFVKHDALLLSGLVNAHVIRTAEMMDIKCVIFVRGKRPGADVIDVAEDCGIAILCTEKTMFTACGLLYKNGLTGSAG